MKIVKKAYRPQKTPLIATCTNERRSGSNFNTVSRKHANIATRFFRSSLLQTEGRLTKILHQFTSRRSTLAAKRYIIYFK